MTAPIVLIVDSTIGLGRRSIARTTMAAIPNLPLVSATDRLPGTADMANIAFSI